MGTKTRARVAGLALAMIGSIMLANPAQAKFSSSTAVRISIGGIVETASNDSEAYYAALRVVQRMCASGYRVGFAGYPHNATRSGNTITYQVTTLAASCWNNSTVAFAVTGYDGGAEALCPVAGWYHHGSWETRDCIKYQSPSSLGDAGDGKGSGHTAYCDPCGHCGKSYHVNDCRSQGAWWNVVSGGGASAPPTIDGIGSSTRTYGGFTYKGTVNFSASSGSVKYIDNALGDYWIYPGTSTSNDSSRAKVRIEATYVWNNTPDITTTGKGTVVRTVSGNRTVHNWTSDTIKTARPKQTAEWKHTLSVKCSSDTFNESFSSWVNRSGDWSGRRSFTPNIKCGDNVDSNGRKILSADDTRKTFCENAGYRYEYSYVWVDGKGNVHNDRRSISDSTSPACVYIPYHVPGCQGNGCSPSQGCREGDGSSCKNTNLSQSGVVGSADIISNGSSISGGTVSYNQDIDFKYTFNNRYGPSKSPNVTYTAHIFTLEGEYTPTSEYKSFTFDPSPKDMIPSHSNEYFINDSVPGSTGELGPGETVWRKYDGGRVDKVSNIDGQPGDRICTYVVMGVNASMVNDEPSNTYVASPMKCVRIAKRPQLQINGSDSYAGGGFIGTTYNDDALRGSYTQYSQLTNTGASSLFGSAGYTHLSDSSTGDVNWSRMIYANAGRADENASNGHLLSGGLSEAYRTSEVMTRLNAARDFATSELHIGASSANSLDVNSLASDKFNNVVVNPAGGTLKISGTQARAGAIMVNGDAEIAGNIGDMNSYNDNGMLTIYATGDISISASVDQIHANLVAGGKVITCSGAGGTGGSKAQLGQKVNTCGAKLKVNGAIISHATPAFQRTFGAGSCDESRQGRTCEIGYRGEKQYNYWWVGATSEWINYTPDSWYLANKMIGGNRLKAYQTTMVMSRPARY